MDAPRPIGLHLQTRANRLAAADRAVAIGAAAVQIFADNPAAWRRRPEPPADLDEFLARLHGGGISTLAIHGSYLLNLASPDEVIRARTIATIAHDLNAAAAYGAVAVNVHIGSHMGSGLDVGVARVGTAIHEALDQAPVTGAGNDPLLVLENSAGGGGAIGAPLEELAAVLDAAAAAGADADRVAFCLDTAHLWGAGYDIRDTDHLDNVLTRFHALVGLERLALLHLNDSRAALGSRVDRHQHVAAGEIGPTGMAAVLTDPRLAHVPMFVETEQAGGLDLANQERIRLLLAGQLDLPPLPELPPPKRPRMGSRRPTGTSGL